MRKAPTPTLAASASARLRGLLEASGEQDGFTPRGMAVAGALLALKDPERAALPPAEAIRTQLELLASVGPMREVSLWTFDDGGRVRCTGHAGGRPSSGVRGVARQALVAGRETPPGAHRRLVAVGIGPATAPTAALAARVPAGRSAEALLLLAEASALLSCVLERQALLEAGEQEAADAIAAAERRLARCGLDLHDGPLQVAVALLSDLRLFATQLESELAEGELAAILTGRVADLEARALALEGQIRELARSAGAPAALTEPLRDLLRSEARSLAQATGADVQVEVRGRVDAATPSQRIALLRGVQEALRNTEEHARAKKVRLKVEAQPERIVAEVRDDGRGFDVERTIARAVRDGRLGLAGIIERVGMLGGSVQVRSRRGQTSVTISLPRWEPGGAPASFGS
ncbi:MAG TPA: ATP-binding protein [Solirubrobacterales bacterium]|nr:ATP-binding protein [Solirubrobacterales bacterium]